ncbi:MAG: Hsp20/alpha crystallin family protein [Treponema sp.]|jgi:HSP20 family molecular chaperone IbpA|nr:Hsp20/alpha crystallin family protein [Treponema sp.]
MKGTRPYMDLGSIFDEIFEAAQDFKDEFHRNFHRYNPGGSDGSRNDGSGGNDNARGNDGFGQGPFGFGKRCFDENTDFYPNYSYPPMNVFMTGDRTMVFEFALAGFDEKDISLSFQGDYMVFSAKISENFDSEKSGAEQGEDDAAKIHDENIRYFKRRLKMKDIEKQKYFVPLDKYAQEEVRAVYRNGILRVSVPPKDEPDQNEGIKIEIIKEGN